MIRNRVALARRAIAGAMGTRQAAGVALICPLCIFDFVENRGVEIRFEQADSMEGLYIKEPGPLILIGSARPIGRQAFTCAHEYAHHWFDHGTRLDEIDRKSAKNDPDEFLADCFAGYLLMPKTAVLRAFADRQLSVDNLTPEQAYAISTLFGVGYGTFVQHMNSGLGLLSEPQATALLKHTPQSIRSAMVQCEPTTHLVVVDEHWRGRPIDLQIGDHLLLAPGMVFEGTCVKQDGVVGMQPRLIAIATGLGRILLPQNDWTSFVRVSRREYSGLCAYRHLEET